MFSDIAALSPYNQFANMGWCARIEEVAKAYKNLIVFFGNKDAIGAIGYVHRVGSATSNGDTLVKPQKLAGGGSKL